MEGVHTTMNALPPSLLNVLILGMSAGVMGTALGSSDLDITMMRLCLKINIQGKNANSTVKEHWWVRYQPPASV